MGFGVFGYGRVLRGHMRGFYHLGHQGTTITHQNNQTGKRGKTPVFSGFNRMAVYGGRGERGEGSRLREKARACVGLRMADISV